MSGFGIDEMVNRSAGDFEIKAFRKTFGGIKTGEAKTSPAFKHTKVKLIIHAVGPVFRDNAVRDKASVSVAELDGLLARAYQAALGQAAEHGCKTVGFCLLSAGVFRGSRPLADVIMIGLRAMAADARPPLREIAVFAFSKEEQVCGQAVFRDFVEHWQLAHIKFLTAGLNLQIQLF